jgi:hypothetical protein
MRKAERSRDLHLSRKWHGLESSLPMKLPTFVIATIKDDVPKAMRNFVGVWVNKDGYEGGGRKAMLIVTDVASDGSIGGHYVWGPPAKGSWVRDVAGSTPFRGIFRNGEFNFDLGSVVTGNVTTMNVALKGRQMIVRPRMRTLTEVKTSLGYFSPLWQLEAN